MATAMSVDEIDVRQGEIKARLEEIDAEFAGQALPEESRDEWHRLNEEQDGNRKLREELVVRSDRLKTLGSEEKNTEQASFQAPKRDRARGDDIYDLTTVRANVGSPEEANRELVERAKQAIEFAVFPHTDRSEAQEHVTKLVERMDGVDSSIVARHILQTGSPAYKRAFGKYLSGKYLTNDEERALSLTGSAGGFAVPFELDPTIIPTSSLAVNPFRSVARVVQITGDEWRGISSAGITAAYAAEATASSDNAPTLAQPTISTEKAQAFVPFSIEVGMDWNGLQAEMGRLLQDAKDELEATKFALGSGTNEPQGVITGATTVFTAAATNSISVADIYGLEGALGPRFRPRASLVMNRAVAQKIRQFDTAGGASLWIDTLKTGLANNVPTNGSFGANLLGYPTYESSAMSSAFTTGQLVGVLGDFNYYVIVDRIGLTVETIPHLFDVTNNRPTGQRGLYAYWRNSAGVISPNAFRVLKLA